MSEERARLFVCRCGVSTSLDGRAVIWDVKRRQWMLIIWPATEGKKQVSGVYPIAGCPVCLAMARQENTLPESNVPKEAMDHLVSLDSPPPDPRKATDSPFRGVMTDLPQPEEK